MRKLLTAVSSAVFLWAFWNASLLGVYIGTYTSKADGELQCRYIAARGVFDEAQADAVSTQNLTSKWCPTTRIVGRDTTSRLKQVRINTASGL